MTEERKTFGYKVAVPLSEQELKEAHEELLQLDVKIDAKESEKSLAMSSFNEDLKTLRAARKAQMSVCTSKVKAVEVAVYEAVDERLGKMITHRADNGEQVSERALTADELKELAQGNLFDGKNGEAGEAGAEGGGEPNAGEAASGEEDEPENDGDLAAIAEEYEAQQGRSATASEDGEADEAAADG